MSVSHTVFYVKFPSTKDKRTSYSIMAKHTPPLNGKKYEKVQSEQLDALNRSFRARLIASDHIDLAVRQFCDSLNAAQKVKEAGQWLASPENLKIFDRFWDAEYSGRDIRRPETARRDLLWAINMIGSTPLTAERRVLQRVVDERSEGNSRRHRRLCTLLNQVRRWLGISNDRLKPMKKQQKDFLYLTKAEFDKILPLVAGMGEIPPEVLQSLFTVLFYSGARTGEAFYFESAHLSKNQLKVLRQIDRQGKVCPTKNGKVRTTLLEDFGIGAFYRWVEFGSKGKIARTSLAKVFKAACKKAFPENPKKWVTVHDLRHSFAVRCLTVHRLRLEDIARLLGDTVAVCEEYYVAFVENEEYFSYLVQRTKHQSM